MPQWAGSCWYYLRFIDPKNSSVFADKEKLDYWGPVSLYVGGAEHAVLHLLYARFWHKVLFDMGAVSTPEPFMALRNQGMILGENGEKMSKSRGNVVNPDDVIRQYGADTLRTYEMFMGPLAADKPWNTQSIQGPFRFLERSWRLMSKEISDQAVVPDELDRLRHKSIKAVSQRIEALEFNTAISQLMIFLNALEKQESLSRELLKDYVRLLHPFAPFLTEEMWEQLGEQPSIINAEWPQYDPAKTIDEEINLVVQVNGKLRDTIRIPRDLNEEEMRKVALSSERVKPFITGKELRKVVVVPGKLVNIVV
jgi:leucyl-tRNA synthetase